MFQALLCPSSEARDYDVVYHIGRVVIGLLQAQAQLVLEPAARTLLQPNYT